MDSLILSATTRWYNANRGKNTWEGSDLLTAYNAMQLQNPTPDECREIILSGNLPERISAGSLPDFSQ
jgi:hypothetical protein